MSDDQLPQVTQSFGGHNFHYTCVLGLNYLRNRMDFSVLALTLIAARRLRAHALERHLLEMASRAQLADDQRLLLALAAGQYVNASDIVEAIRTWPPVERARLTFYLAQRDMTAFRFDSAVPRLKAIASYPEPTIEGAAARHELQTCGDDLDFRRDIVNSTDSMTSELEARTAAGDTRGAVFWAQLLVGIAPDYLPESDSSIVHGLAVLGELYRKAGDLDQAGATNERALKAVENSFAPDSVERSLFLNNLSQVRLEQGRREEAQELLQKVLLIETSREPPIPGDLAATYNNLAMVLIKQNRHRAALVDLAKAESLWTEAGGREQVCVGQCLNNRASALLALAEPEAAELAAAEALSIFLKLLGPEDVLTRSAKTYRDEARHQQRVDGAYAEGHIDDETLRQLERARASGVIIDQGNRDLATRAIRLALRDGKKDCLKYAAALWPLPPDLSQASPAHTRNAAFAVAAAHAVFGDENLAADLLEKLDLAASPMEAGGLRLKAVRFQAAFLASRGEFDAAFRALNAVVEWKLTHGDVESLIGLSGIRRDIFIRHFRRWLDLSANFMAMATDPVDAGEADGRARAVLESYIRFEVLQRETLALQSPRCLTERFPSSREKWAELRDIDELLYEQRLIVPHPREYEQQPSGDGTLWSRRRRILEETVVAHALEPLRTSLAEFSLDSVLEELGRDSVLFYYVIVPQLEFERNTIARHGGLEEPGVLDFHKDDRASQLLRFCARWEGERVKVDVRALGSWRSLRTSMLAHAAHCRTARVTALPSYSPYFEEALRETKWADRDREWHASYIRVRALKHASLYLGMESQREKSLLSEHPDRVALAHSLFVSLADGRSHAARKWFIGGDAPLLTFPFDALVASDGNALLHGAEHSFFVPRLKRAPGKHASAPVVVSAPSYDLSDPAVCLSTETLSSIAFKCSYGQPAAQILWFNDLAGAAKEGQAVATQLGGVHLSGAEALKQAVVTLSSPSVLHFATHAYLFGEEEGGLKEIGILPVGYHLGVEQSDTPGIGAVLDPFSRAGLALAGANWRFDLVSPPAATGDGVLTARDVLGMDLSGTQLAVLSACDTGRGESLIGRPIAGLMEAFLVAGVRCVVASLWKVADAETAEMMQLFYHELKTGRSVGTALMLAKRQMIARYPSRPEVWASFQCYGDAGVTLF